MVLLDKFNAEKKQILLIIGMLVVSVGFPKLVENVWFDIIVKIREASITGDSGHLILASALNSIIFAVQSATIYISVSAAASYFEKKYSLQSIYIALLQTITFIALSNLTSVIYAVPWEPITNLCALILLLLLIKDKRFRQYYYTQRAIISLQVFFAFQWLNIMPVFTMYYFGQSDIPLSIKLTGEYINSTAMLNFIGFSFFLPFAFSAMVTSTLFRSYGQNLLIMKENYKKEKEIQIMKSKVIENRIYQEINLLAHDLKTPLVTIRGLNSLLPMTNDQSRLKLYSKRIEGAAEKMNEMVSSFLYGSSRQLVNPRDLINYIRAQIPTEDDKLKVELDFDKQLPNIVINKVRVARAIVNLLENAIVVPYRHAFKHIVIEVRAVKEGLRISISDNGVGISQADMSKIWDIGYSTGQTSGLGLPFAKQIIEENDGTLQIESEQNKGTVATVLFPAVKEDHDETNKKR